MLIKACIFVCLFIYFYLGLIVLKYYLLSLKFETILRFCLVYKEGGNILMFLLFAAFCVFFCFISFHSYGLSFL